MEMAGKRSVLVGLGLGCVALALFAMTLPAAPRPTDLEAPSLKAKSSKIAAELHRSHRLFVQQNAHTQGAARASSHPRMARTTGLNMHCCVCDGSSVDLPAVPCQDCYECAKKPYSPYYNPYGDRKDKEVTLPKLLETKAKVQPAKEGFLLHDEKDAATPTDRMLTLNKIIAGSKNFVAPPRTPDVYQIVTKKFVHKDPLVQVS
mmetsp:Transcript_23805/g.37214  ORF Transcript_23805/g.37214 Transcript_23805/m.37214 type:complete len:204 (-) Transcript_23805:231-842(-)